VLELGDVSTVFPRWLGFNCLQRRLTLTHFDLIAANSMPLRFGKMTVAKLRQYLSVVQ
jgi:hypothetical protein